MREKLAFPKTRIKGMSMPKRVTTQAKMGLKKVKNVM